MVKDTQAEELKRYQTLLGTDKPTVTHGKQSLENIPLLWWDIKQEMGVAGAGLRQYRYAVIGHVPNEAAAGDKALKPVLLNTEIPWSAFLCGSQGSGKSYTLSCMLENCLLQGATGDAVGKNMSACAGLVFHYDRSQGKDVCEAAYLCQHVPTTVLVSRSNLQRLEKKYKDMARSLGANVQIDVHPLDLRPEHLNTERMKTLMAVGKAGEMPLYMSVRIRKMVRYACGGASTLQVIINILREMAIGNPNGGLGDFVYSDSIARLDKAGFSEMQSGPLNMRLDLLESYVDVQSRPRVEKNSRPGFKKQPKTSSYVSRIPDGTPDHLAGESGKLTIIDLTDPVVEPDAACVLLDVCLSIFMSRTDCAKIVALDEAHNYMTAGNSAAAQFTERLLKIIRQQRHEGARVVIATQEPSINPRLLDFCNITMVHRFTSPAWFAVLKDHIAALKGVDDQKVFEEIVRLSVGQSLLFCPKAVNGIDEARKQLTTMGASYVRFKTRTRKTADGGRSKFATGS